MTQITFAFLDYVTFLSGNKFLTSLAEIGFVIPSLRYSHCPKLPLLHIKDMPDVITPMDEPFFPPC